MNSSYLGHMLRVVRKALHSSLKLCRFGHAEWKMVQCLKMTLEWLEWRQDTSIVNLNYCLLIALKWKLLICLRDQSAIFSHSWVMRYLTPKVLSREILWLQVKNEGAVSLVALMFRSIQTPVKLTHSPTPDHDLLLSNDQFVLYTHSNSANSPNQPCCSPFKMLV